MAVKLSWKSWANQNPGYSVWAAVPSRDADTLYVIRRKKPTADFKPTGWRVFARREKGATLETIFMDPNLNNCKKFVQDLEDAFDDSE